MRHAKRTQRLSRPTDQRLALLDGLVRNLVIHGQITTTHARAKEAQRLADRLVSWGKEGSVASRRRALRILRDRSLVKQLFSDIAPRFGDLPSGYTRVLRVSVRPGDGAQRSVLAFSRLPVTEMPARPAPKAAPAPRAPTAPQRSMPKLPEQEVKQPKGLFQGLRKLWTRQKKGSGAS